MGIVFAHVFTASGFGSRGLRFRRFLIVAAIAAFVCAGAWLALNWSNASEIASKLDRLKLWECYVLSMFKNFKLLLFGIGFENTESFCQVQTASGFHYHAHNLAIHVAGTTGLLGLLGLTVLSIRLFHAWLKSLRNCSSVWRFASVACLSYVTLQMVVDLSAFHYPITLIFTGLYVSPYARPVSKSLSA